MLENVTQSQACRNDQVLDEDYLDEHLYKVGQLKDESSFLEVYDFYAGRVKAHFLNFDVTERAAEHLMQQVMLAVWRMSASFNPADIAASTWIFSIVRNQWLEFKRGDSRIEVELDDELLVEDSR